MVLFFSDVVGTPPFLVVVRHDFGYLVVSQRILLRGGPQDLGGFSTQCTFSGGVVSLPLLRRCKPYRCLLDVGAIGILVLSDVLSVDFSGNRHE